MSQSEYLKVIKSDDELARFLKALAKFDRAFCDNMAEGTDFTLKLEIHGAGGRIVHCRSNVDSFDRPHGNDRPGRKNNGDAIAQMCPTA